jgi:hypothetical protein
MRRISVPGPPWAVLPWAILLLGHGLAWSGAASFEHLSELGDQLRRLEAGEGWGLIPQSRAGGASGGSSLFLGLAAIPWRLGLGPGGLFVVALVLDGAALALWLKLAGKAWGSQIALIGAIFIAADPTAERYLAENSALLPVFVTPLLPAWVIALEKADARWTIGCGLLLAAATSISGGALAAVPALFLSATHRRRWDLAAVVVLAAAAGLAPVAAGLPSEIGKLAAWAPVTSPHTLALTVLQPGLVVMAVALPWRWRELQRTLLPIVWAGGALAFALGPAAPYLGCDPFHVAVGLPAFALLGARAVLTLRGTMQFRAGLVAGLLAITQAGAAAPRITAPVEEGRWCRPGLPDRLVAALDAAQLLPPRGEVVFHGLYAHCLDGWWVWQGRHRGEAAHRATAVELLIAPASLLPNAQPVLDGLRAVVVEPARPDHITMDRLTWTPDDGGVLVVELASQAAIVELRGGTVLAAWTGPSCTTGHHTITLVERVPRAEMVIQLSETSFFGFEDAVRLLGDAALVHESGRGVERPPGPRPH